MNIKKKVIGIILIILSFLVAFVLLPIFDSLKTNSKKTNSIGSIDSEKISSDLYSFNTLNGKYGVVSIEFPKNSDYLANNIKKGDVVSIIKKDTLKGNYSISPNLRYVYILKKESIDDGERIVTFFVNKQQAIELAEIEESGKLKIFLVYRGSKENTIKYLNEQDRFLSKVNK